MSTHMDSSAYTFSWSSNYASPFSVRHPGSRAQPTLSVSGLGIVVLLHSLSLLRCERFVNTSKKSPARDRSMMDACRETLLLSFLPFYLS